MSNRTDAWVRAGIVAGACSVAALLVTGCAARTGGAAAPQQSQQATGGGSAGRGANAPKVIDSPIAASQLRERAMARIEELASHPDASVRANAVEAAQQSPRRLRGVIERGLNDTTPGVRAVAAMSVGKAQLSDQIPAVRELLADATPQVRASALLALAQLGEVVDPSPLAGMLLSDPSPWVNRHAMFVLGEMGNRTALPLINAALRERGPSLPPAQQRIFQVLAAEAMVKLGERDQVAVLRAALYPSQAEDFEAAALAAQSLGVLNDAPSLGQLVNVMNQRNRAGQAYPAEVRLAIATAVARINRKGGPEAERINANVLAVADEFRANAQALVRAQTAFVYGALPGTRHWDRLALLLEDESPAVQVAAAAAMVRASR